jgi:hypothetical protein
MATLEQRVDEALATARASAAAVMTVGAAALDAAEQARRAAELAERASAALLAERCSSPPFAAEAALVPPEPAVGEIRVTGPEVPVPASEDDPLRAFHLRADRVVARLRALGTGPVGLAPLAS